MSLQFAPDHDEIERRVEALLFAAAAPLSAAEIARRLPEGADVGGAISGLRERYQGRGVELECVADRWRFRTAPDLAFLMTEERDEPRRLSKAALETLAAEPDVLQQMGFAALSAARAYTHATMHQRRAAALLRIFGAGSPVSLSR